MLKESKDILEDKNKSFNSSVFSFEKFITFDENMIAAKASKIVARNPKTAYNPLFLYGKGGTGKTHLLKAIEDFATKSFPDMNIMYVTAESFYNDIIAATNSGISWAMADIRDLYRTQDVLLIDNLQFLIGKEIALSELSSAIDSILGDGNQIVFAANKPPRALKVSAHMKTQLSSGLIAELKAPDISMMQNVIRMKANERDILLSDDVVEYISENVGSNVSEIDGALTSLVAYLALYRPTVSLDSAKTILSDVFNTAPTDTDGDS